MFSQSTLSRGGIFADENAAAPRTERVDGKPAQNGKFRRSALGDVTNRHTNSNNYQRKASEGFVTKPAVNLKAVGGTLVSTKLKNGPEIRDDPVEFNFGSSDPAPYDEGIDPVAMLRARDGLPNAAFMPAVEFSKPRPVPLQEPTWSSDGEREDLVKFDCDLDLKLDDLDFDSICPITDM